MVTLKKSIRCWRSNSRIKIKWSIK